MMMKKWLNVLSLAGVGGYCLFIGAAVQAADDPTKPNFLFIQSDQYRYDLLRFVQDSMPRYAGKTKVRTPNLDRLRSEGVYFSQAYTQCAVCGPSRATFRTGCTLERHGEQSNDLDDRAVYSIGSLFKNKIEAAVSFEMVLVENKGYLAEHYGKWHMPEIFNWSQTGATRIMSYNDYDYVNNQPKFNTSSSSLDYDKRLAEIAGGQSTIEQTGMQRNSYSHYPYVTDAIDKRHGLAPYSTLTVVEPDQQGRDTLPVNLTPSCLETRAALAAIDRLAANAKPFCLTVSYHNPHAPMVAAGLYYDYYKALESNMLLPDSLSGADTANSGWNMENNSKYQNAAMVKEWMVAYYALCEEVDKYVGQLLDKLDAKGIADNTFVIFVADHGEALGSHGCREKSKFWEESAHIPLLMRFPGRIAAGSTVNESVATLDCFATILDYLGASTYNNSDGKSLRRFIEKTNYNKDYDDEAIVTEWDFRTPLADGTLDRELGSVPNFLCKKGPWKLMMTKLAISTEKDMLYNLDADPYEMGNLIGDNGMTASDTTIGKAEHLKCLLMEWMQRMDGGTNKYYSDKKWNGGEGLGDLAEIKARRKWKSLNIWVSDTAVNVGPTVSVSGQLTRNEYIYLGRTTSGTLTVSNITVQGANAGLFQLSEFTSGAITSGNYKRVKLTYRPTSTTQTVTDARIVIRHSAGADKVITLSAVSSGTAPSVPAVGSTITLKAVNGKYVSATYSTNNTLIADKTAVSSFERFQVINATNCIALKCIGTGKFVGINSPSGSKPMLANRPSIGSYEKFKFVQNGTQIAICSVLTTNYASAISNGAAPLQASQTYVGAYEKFTWKVE